MVQTCIEWAAKESSIKSLSGIQEPRPNYIRLCLYDQGTTTLFLNEVEEYQNKYHQKLEQMEKNNESQIGGGGDMS